MTSRELTELELSSLLTQEEVNALPNGTKIMVKWSGGHGPYEYFVVNRHGDAFAVTDKDRTSWGHRLEFVGKNRFNDRVFIRYFDD